MQLAIRLLWLPFVFGRFVSAQRATCYNSFGTSIPFDIEACDLSATGKAGSHSACCNAPNKDVCLSSGLCLASWSTGSDQMFWIGGCTDSTWQDPACSRLCVGDAGDKATSYSLMACSNSTWCCAGHFNFQEAEGSRDDCCKRAFTLSEDIGTVVRQFTGTTNPTRTSSSGSSTATPTTSINGNGPAATCAPNSSIGASASTGGGSDSKMVAIVGGVLGAVLAASLVAVAVLGFSNWKLRKQLREGGVAAGTATASTGGDHDSKSSPVMQQGWPGIPHTATELSATDRTPELDASQRARFRR